MFQGVISIRLKIIFVVCRSKEAVFLHNIVEVAHILIPASTRLLFNIFT
jgi:hypothetical protein